MSGITILAGDGSAFLANLKDEPMSEIGKALGQPKVSDLDEAVKRFNTACTKCDEFWAVMDEARLDQRVAQREGKQQIADEFAAKEVAARGEWVEWRMVRRDQARAICQELGVSEKQLASALS